MAKFSYGSRVKHRTYKWLKDAGTVIAVQPELWPFVTVLNLHPSLLDIRLNGTNTVFRGG